jgi:hypothetical protein
MRIDIKLTLGSLVCMFTAAACYAEEEPEGFEESAAIEQANIDNTAPLEAVCPAFSVRIPNFFSPNGDGINDRWAIMDGNGGVGSIWAINYSMLIFDDKGFIVYDRHGIEKSRMPGWIVYYNGGEISWSGRETDNGPVLPQGVYVYRLSLLDCNRQTATRMGSITLFH